MFRNKDTLKTDLSGLIRSVLAYRLNMNEVIYPLGFTVRDINKQLPKLEMLFKNMQFIPKTICNNCIVTMKE